MERASETEFEIVFKHFANSGPVNLNHIVVDKEAIESVILTYGQDPSRVTTVEMDRLDTRLTCAKCDTEGDLEVMNWRAAVRLHASITPFS